MREETWRAGRARISSLCPYYGGHRTSEVGEVVYSLAENKKDISTWVSVGGGSGWMWEGVWVSVGGGMGECGDGWGRGECVSRVGIFFLPRPYTSKYYKFASVACFFCVSVFFITKVSSLMVLAKCVKTRKRLRLPALMYDSLGCVAYCIYWSLSLLFCLSCLYSSSSIELLYNSSYNSSNWHQWV